ncbi:MAG: hypothetical protein ACRD8U_19540, partial [Pyrinomonadaceae bacterium]
MVPIYVNLSGRGHAELSSVISEEIAKTYGVRYSPDPRSLLKAISLRVPIVIIFDGLDEQHDLTPRGMSRLFRATRDICLEGIRTILAFRPEVFDSYKTIRELFVYPTTGSFINWHYIELEGIQWNTKLEGEIPFLGMEGLVT